LLRWPGRTKAGKYSDLVSTVDVAPTILSACGVKAPKEMAGLSLLGAAAGKGRLKRKAVFGGTFEPTAKALQQPAVNLTHRWVREGDWKLIVPVKGKAELYDLKRDPFEKQDRAAKGPERVEALTGTLDAWWKGR